MFRKTSPKPKKSDLNPKDIEQLGQMLVSIYETGYIDRNQAYKMSFIKGLLGGLGGVVGATLVVALLLWTLSFFDDVPLIGRLFENVESSINTRQK